MWINSNVYRHRPLYFTNFNQISFKTLRYILYYITLHYILYYIILQAVYYGIVLLKPFENGRHRTTATFRSHGTSIWIASLGGGLFPIFSLISEISVSKSIYLSWARGTKIFTLGNGGETKVQTNLIDFRHQITLMLCSQVFIVIVINSR